MVTTCNSVFRKLRRTRKIVRKKTQSDGGAVPAIAAASAPSTEEAQRLQRELQAEVEAAKQYRLSLQQALEELDDDDDDGEDGDGTIRYEDYAEEFAEIALQADQEAAATRAERTVMLLMRDDGGMEESTDDGDFAEVKASGVNFDDDEYLVTHSGTT